MLEVKAEVIQFAPGETHRSQALWPYTTPITDPLHLLSGQLCKRQSSSRSAGSERVRLPFDNPVLYKTKTLQTNRDSNFRRLLTISVDLTEQLLAPYKCPIRLDREIIWMAKCIEYTTDRQAFTIYKQTE